MNAPVESRSAAVPAFAPVLIYPSVELAWSLESDAYPKTDFHSIQFRGPIDVPAFVEAFDETVPTYPVAHCRLEERRVGIHRRLFWAPIGRRNSLIVDDCRGRVTAPVDGVAFAAEYFREKTCRRIDLFRDPPVRFYLLRLADEVTLFSTVHQHIAMDAASAYGFFRDLLARYHEKVKGERPAWAAASSTNTAGNAPVAVRSQPILAYLRELVRNLRRGGRGGVSMIATSGPRDVLGRNMNRGVFDAETLRGIKNYCRRHDATMVDALLAVILRTIGAWDREHGLEQEWIHAALAVNVRNRFAALKEQSFGMSGLGLFYRRPEEARLDDLVGRLRDERARLLDLGVDVSMIRMLAAVFQVLGVLPPRARAAIIRSVVTFPTTFVLSNVGIMWPEVRDGKLTGRSAFTRAGDFELDDIHACPSLTPDVGMGIVTRTMGDRLYINYNTDRSRFRPEEADALTARITDAIRALGRSA
jgi:hypothetical protein